MRGSRMSLSEAKETLGVGDGYTKQEVKSARNSLIKRYHPDVSDDPHAEEILKKINEAYQVLMDSYDAEQERVRAKQAAEREQKRKAAEQERARQAAQQERANQAAERERARQAEEQKRRNSQEWRERQTSNAGQEWQDGTSQQERQRQAAEEQWRRRTEEARRDRAEQSRRQRERWEAMQREQERQAETQREQERWEAMRREQERQEAKRRDQERKEAQRREQERREAERRESERRDREDYERGWNYWVACRKAQEAKTAEEHEEVASLFEDLGDYQDSPVQCESNRSKAADMRAKHQERKKKAVPINILSILPTGLCALAYFVIALNNRSATIIAFMWIIPVMFIAVLWLGLVKNMDNTEAPIDRDALKAIGGCLLVIAFCTYTITHSQALLLTVAAELMSLVGCLFGCESKADSSKRITLSCLAWIILIAAVILSYSG